MSCISYLAAQKRGTKTLSQRISHISLSFNCCVVFASYTLCPRQGSRSKAKKYAEFSVDVFSSPWWWWCWQNRDAFESIVSCSKRKCTVLSGLNKMRLDRALFSLSLRMQSTINTSLDSAFRQRSHIQSSWPGAVVFLQIILHVHCARSTELRWRTILTSDVIVTKLDEGAGKR